MTSLLRWTLALTCSLALLAQTTFAETCVVEGEMYLNGYPIEGEELRCVHSGGIDVTVIEPTADGINYRCEVNPGPVSLEVGTCSFTACTEACEGPDCEPVRCNVSIAACTNVTPCGLALLLMPPFALRRLRGRTKSTPS